MSAFKRLAHHRYMRAAVAYTNQQFNVLSVLFAKQCEAVAAQRVRRAWQLCILYSRMYDRRLLKRFVDHFKQRLALYRLTYGRQALISAAMFSMCKTEITDDEMSSEMQCLMDDFAKLSSSFDIKRTSLLASTNSAEAPVSNTSEDANPNSSQQSRKWELVINEPGFRAWRSMNPEWNVYEYRVFGSFDDVAARSFFVTQVDLAYRKKWDASVLSIDRVDTNGNSNNDSSDSANSQLQPGSGTPPTLSTDEIAGNRVGSETELIRWITQYPYPLSAREYVYHRRYFYDAARNVFFVMSRSANVSEAEAVDSIDKTPDPVQTKYVRCDRYKSTLIIRPHSTDASEHGLDYFLAYVDEPQSSIPTRFANWCATTGLTKCHRMVHDATVKLEHEQQQLILAYNVHTRNTATEGDSPQAEAVPGAIQNQQTGPNDEKTTESLEQPLPMLSSAERVCETPADMKLNRITASKLIDSLIAKWVAYQRAEASHNSDSLMHSEPSNRQTEDDMRRSALATFFLSRR